MKKVIFILFFLSISYIANAQPGRPMNPVPIDSGLVVLAAAGAKLGYNAYKKKKGLK